MVLRIDSDRPVSRPKWRNTTGRRLWATRDGSRVVDDGDPEAAFLIVGINGLLSYDDAERFGLVGAGAGAAHIADVEDKARQDLLTPPETPQEDAQGDPGEDAQSDAGEDAQADAGADKSSDLAAGDVAALLEGNAKAAIGRVRASEDAALLQAALEVEERGTVTAALDSRLRALASE